MKKLFLIGFSTLLLQGLQAQKKDISLEDIWKTPTFRSNGVYGLVSMKDGIHYTTFDGSDKDAFILRYEYAKKSNPDTLLKESTLKVDGKAISIDNYSFSPDETKMLISSGTEQIYRHSTRENNYVYDRKAKTLTPVSTGEKQMYATFSPDGTRIGFVRGNNIFIKDLASGKETQVTSDGLLNNIINGATDWVHEEEFAFSVAYFWSPDSKKNRLL